MKRPLIAAFFALLVSVFFAAISVAAEGRVEYEARVLHNQRGYFSQVKGVYDFASGDCNEAVESSYHVDWKQYPSGLEPSKPLIPSIWRVGGDFAHRYGEAMPQYDNELMRHFILGELLTDFESIEPGDEFMKGQLVINTVDFGHDGFEVVAQLRGDPVVLVAVGEQHDGFYTLQNMAVLGANVELYHYFFDRFDYYENPVQTALALPEFRAEDYVAFPNGGAQPVAIMPVKDWLVFRAFLPNGRPLNLVFDSGAEKMIIDDLVLELDADLNSVGKVPVAGAYEVEEMDLYEGFSLSIGGVEFSNMTVIGAPMTKLGYGADIRIHGIVGGDILKLCQLDLDLVNGEMMLAAAGSDIPNQSEELPITFIRELPHVEAEVQDTGKALLMLDTGQRASLSVNLDWLDGADMGDDLKMNGFVGGIAGGLMPRYIMEELNFSFAGNDYLEKSVDAGAERSFAYGGLPVVGAIGFPMISRHFGGITFDYSRQRVYLRDPGDNLRFRGSPQAWETEDRSWQLVASNNGDENQSIRTGADETEAMGSSEPAGDEAAEGDAEMQAEAAADPQQIKANLDEFGEQLSWSDYWNKLKKAAMPEGSETDASATEAVTEEHAEQVASALIEQGNSGASGDEIAMLLDHAKPDPNSNIQFSLGFSDISNLTDFRNGGVKPARLKAELRGLAFMQQRSSSSIARRLLLRALFASGDISEAEYEEALLAGEEEDNFTDAARREDYPFGRGGEKLEFDELR